jgi:hypothetical protein
VIDATENLHNGSFSTHAAQPAMSALPSIATFFVCAAEAGSTMALLHPRSPKRLRLIQGGSTDSAGFACFAARKLARHLARLIAAQHRRIRRRSMAKTRPAQRTDFAKEIRLSESLRE